MIIDNDKVVARELDEYQSLYGDPKYARRIWQITALQRFARQAQPPLSLVDSKTGEVMPQSLIEQQIYLSLLSDLKEKGLTRNPTEGEMILACQAYYARHNTASFVAFRDTAGAKPIDESKITQETSPYEQLTDEELQALSDLRAKKTLASPSNVLVNTSDGGGIAQNGTKIHSPIF